VASSFLIDPVLVLVLVLEVHLHLGNLDLELELDLDWGSYRQRASVLAVVDVVAYIAVGPFERYWDPSFASLAVVGYLAYSLGMSSEGMLGSLWSICRV